MDWNQKSKYSIAWNTPAFREQADKIQEDMGQAVRKITVSITFLYCKVVVLKLWALTPLGG